MKAIARPLVGWVSIPAAPLGIFNIYCYMVAVNGDVEALFKPATALALSPTAIEWFRVGMLADSFSFYLPFLLIGGFIWTRLRDRADGLVDIAILALVVYVVLGIAGTSMQIVTLPALAATHAGGDAVIKAASESAWQAIVLATERGLWWMEGPLLAFWAIVTGRALHREGWGSGRALVVSGYLYAVIFVCAFVGMNRQVEDVLLGGVTILVPLWLVLFGVGLLRNKNVPAYRDRAPG